jgi:hypothetical protein
MLLLKSGDFVHRCSTQKSCKASVTTDEKGMVIIRSMLNMTTKAINKKPKKNNCGYMSENGRCSITSL